MEEGVEHGIAFHSERMNISALSKNRYYEELRDAYRKKYDGLPIDLIIAVNYRVLNFLNNHGEELWPNTPILFCGVEKGRQGQLKQLRPNITGLFADARFGNMLDTILKIHPDTQQITVIVGTSETERFIEARVRQTFHKYVGRVDFTFLGNLGFDAILNRVADLPPNSIVLFLTLLQDGEGKSVPENSLPLISRVSNVPVYGLFDVYVGHGIVGGSLYSVENRGIMIGKMGVRILTGEKPRDIPIGTGQRHFNLYDWRQLKRWGIAERDLPPKSIIRYREPTFYQLYKWYIWGAVVLIMVETGLINFLLINRAQRRRAERELQRAHQALLKSQEEFRNLAGKLLSVQESERRRLAREMHDDLTQRLAVLAIDIGKIERDFQDTKDPVVGNLQSIRERLVSLSGDIHAISRQLHPSILEDLGLVDAIKSECSSFTRREGITVDYHNEGVPPRIPADVAICIYRIVQEGLRNVAKHSGATQLQISLIGKDDSIHLTIKDQGAGFDLKEDEKKLGLGLVSMQERVRLIQGNISIESQPGKGTVINVRASLKDS
jgi:signal transduction histidine kinase